MSSKNPAPNPTVCCKFFVLLFGTLAAYLRKFLGFVVCISDILRQDLIIQSYQVMTSRSTVLYLMLGSFVAYSTCGQFVHVGYLRWCTSVFVSFLSRFSFGRGSPSLQLWLLFSPRHVPHHIESTESDIWPVIVLHRGFLTCAIEGVGVLYCASNK